MPKPGEKTDDTKTWYQAYKEWADSFFPDYDIEFITLALRGTRARLTYDVAAMIDKTLDTATLPDVAKISRKQFAAIPGVGKITLRYLAAIFRHHGVETPNNWHLTEPEPPKPKK